MDPQRFDTLTKALASATSRRRFLIQALGAGAAALGLTGGSVRTGSAASKDEKHLAKCQQKLAKCGERQKLRQCFDCAARVEAECTDVLGTDLAAAVCNCASTADCDDGNACTLDLCGPTTGTCYHIPISDDCVQCRNDHECPNDAVCCEGRCCPAGGTCHVNAQGIGICCQTCGDGSTGCCDQISFHMGEATVGFNINLGICVGENPDQNLPSFCCIGGQGGYEYDADGNVIIDPETGQPAVGCVLPVGSLP